MGVAGGHDSAGDRARLPAYRHASLGGVSCPAPVSPGACLVCSFLTCLKWEMRPPHHCLFVTSVIQEQAVCWLLQGGSARLGSCRGRASMGGVEPFARRSLCLGCLGSSPSRQPGPSLQDQQLLDDSAQPPQGVAGIRWRFPVGCSQDLLVPQGLGSSSPLLFVVRG